MATFFNKSTPDFSAQFGKGLGDELGSGLQALANMKMQDYAARQAQARQNEFAKQQDEQITKQFGPEFKGIAYLPPQAQGQVFRSIMDQKAAQGYSSLLNSLVNPQQQQQDQLTQQVENEPMTNQPFQVPQGISTKQAEKAVDIALKQKKEQATEQYRNKKLGSETERKNRIQEFTEQKTLKPYLDAAQKEYSEQRKVKHVAEKMLENLQQNRSKWPGAVMGTLHNITGNILVRDKDVRKFANDANTLVKYLANTSKGVPTNYKILLEQMAKANLSQPIETQEAILKDILEEANRDEENQKHIESLKDKKTGKYPLDIQQRVTQIQLAKDNPIDYPQMYEEGPQLELDDGSVVEQRNGTWEPVNA